MTTESVLSPPDLADGMPLDALGDGEMIVGHARGKEVLVVRRGEEIFAVDARCSHYGAPLAEGILVGDTVRCPWHHACFSLRTGAALRAPALHPIGSWVVERRDGNIYVTEERRVEERQRALLAPRPGRSVVIVGGGAAGDAAAETLRRDGFDGAITIMSADSDAPYDRPNISKDYLAGSAPEAWIPLRPAGFYDELGIELRLGQHVTELDTRSRTVRAGDRAPIPYDALVLATGATPVRLPPHVDPDNRVLYLRTLADSRAIIAAAKDARHAVVLGGSFIGLEVAAALRARGLDVAVVAPEPRPLERVLGRELGDVIKWIHEEHGVVFHLGRTASSVEEGYVVLGSGQRLQADIVVAGIGVRPELSLALSGGLTVDTGVVVDEFLETSAPDVYAAGDIAQWRDPRTANNHRSEHWVVAQRQGEAVARNIIARFAGQPPTPFTAVPFFWSTHYDTSISYVGYADRWEETVVAGNFRSGKMSIAFLAGGHTSGVATIGRDVLSLDVELSMERDIEARPEHTSSHAIRAHAPALGIL